MADISLSGALGSGFALIRRRPASVLVWGLLIVLFVQAPILAVLGLGASDLLALAVTGQSRTPPTQQVMEFAFGLQRHIALIEACLLPAIAIRVIISAAVYRAVLEPGKAAFAYLRLGRQEAWLLLLALTFSALAAIAIFPLELVVIAAVLSLAALHAPVVYIAPALTVAALVVLLWAFARLSMAGPMTFADREFRLFESWRLTRRNGLRLLGLALLLIVVVILIELAIAALMAGVAAGLLGGHAIDPRAIQTWLASLTSQGPGLLAWLAPVILIAAAIIGGLNAIAVAPWATAYGQLNNSPNARA
jgi:hypothetical protein